MSNIGHGNVKHQTLQSVATVVFSCVVHKAICNIQSALRQGRIEVCGGGFIFKGRNQ